MKKKAYRFILEHDQRWSFIICYVTLAVVLAIVLNLFWLAVVVSGHGVFEWIKQGTLVKDRIAKAMRVLWELKFDISLVLFGLALEVYIGVILGIAGLGATARAGVEAGSRAAMWQNVLRGTLLSVDDAAQVVRMAGGMDDEGTDGEIDILSGPDVDDELPIEGPTDWKGRLGPWAQPYVLGDWLSLGFGVLCLFMILIGPYITPHDWASMMAALGEEMHPWPIGD